MVKLTTKIIRTFHGKIWHSQQSKNIRNIKNVRNYKKPQPIRIRIFEILFSNLIMKNGQKIIRNNEISKLF